MEDYLNIWYVFPFGKWVIFGIIVLGGVLSGAQGFLLALSSGITPGWACEDNIGCRELNLGLLYARQMPYPVLPLRDFTWLSETEVMGIIFHKLKKINLILVPYARICVFIPSPTLESVFCLVGLRLIDWKKKTNRLNSTCKDFVSFSLCYICENWAFIILKESLNHLLIGSWRGLVLHVLVLRAYSCAQKCPWWFSGNHVWCWGFEPWLYLPKTISSSLPYCLSSCHFHSLHLLFHLVIM